MVGGSGASRIVRILLILIFHGWGDDKYDLFTCNFLGIAEAGQFGLRDIENTPYLRICMSILRFILLSANPHSDSISESLQRKFK